MPQNRAWMISSLGPAFQKSRSQGFVPVWPGQTRAVGQSQDTHPKGPWRLPCPQTPSLRTPGCPAELLLPSSAQGRGTHWETGSGGGSGCLWGPLLSLAASHTGTTQRCPVAVSGAPIPTLCLTAQLRGDRHHVFLERFSATCPAQGRSL